MKRTIRLNESQLNRIIKESVKKVLNESFGSKELSNEFKKANSDGLIGGRAGSHFFDSQGCELAKYDLRAAKDSDIEARFDFRNQNSEIEYKEYLKKHNVSPNQIAGANNIIYILKLESTSYYKYMENGEITRQLLRVIKDYSNTGFDRSVLGDLRMDDRLRKIANSNSNYDGKYNYNYLNKNRIYAKNILRNLNQKERDKFKELIKLDDENGILKQEKLDWKTADLTPHWGYVPTYYDFRKPYDAAILYLRAKHKNKEVYDY